KRELDNAPENGGVKVDLEPEITGKPEFMRRRVFREVAEHFSGSDDVATRQLLDQVFGHAFALSGFNRADEALVFQHGKLSRVLLKILFFHHAVRRTTGVVAKHAADCVE